MVKSFINKKLNSLGKFNMRRNKLFYFSIWVSSLTIFVFILALFIYAMLNNCKYVLDILGFLFGGLLSSFIITLLFYLIAENKYFRFLNKTDLAYKIAESIGSCIGSDSDRLRDDLEKKRIRRDLLIELFPNTAEFVDNYFAKYGELMKKIPELNSFSAFCKRDSEIGHHLSDEQKARALKLRNEFFEELEDLFKKDL
ncbi:hypothetical protein DYE50_07480 [Treponema ruminis]|nr:hypothetical protein DYE50_07480 [Treponema ruminis]